ncbi:hypothetical protein PYW07_000083 [Mythimna separata]|uniref:PiggyBac transposable element-derived protein domain-containing protein n=1 Tax=Mythimna separata TaxID=271217 RepID=A0AAD8E198_MYTSE|nr:hypothetical protein PYW07_000083 [Mythimna separata]
MRPSPEREACPLVEEPEVAVGEPTAESEPAAEPELEQAPELELEPEPQPLEVDYNNMVMRNATTEPACDADMTELETEVLRTEDEINDQVLRDIVPSNDYYTFDWKKDRANFTGRREAFTGLSGPTFDITDKTPVDIFYKMFDTHFIDRLCTETNRYAEQKRKTSYFQHRVCIDGLRLIVTK